MKYYKVIAWLAVASLPGFGAYATPSNTASSAQTAGAPGVAKNSAPVPVHQVPPDYPPMAQYINVQGKVQVCFTVEADGTLANLHIEKAKFRPDTRPEIRGGRNQKALRRAAKESLKAEAVYTMTQWKYKPGYRNGKPVSTPNTCQMIEFQLH